MTIRETHAPIAQLNHARRITRPEFRRGNILELPSLPVGWSWERLGDVAEVVGGVTKDAKKQGNPSFEDVPYLRVANVQRGYLNLDTVTHIRVDAAKARALRLEKGDVLLNEGDFHGDDGSAR